jgi:peptide/nickel transport system substrate-binding protein
MVKIKGQRIAASVVLAIVMGMLVQGAAVGQDATPAEDEKITFTVGMTNDAITFNPMFMIETPEYATADLMYDTYLGWGQEDFATQANLATDWEQSTDGLTWTFTIRDDAMWHDGQPLTAGDIAYTFNWIIDQKIGNFIDYLPYTDEITAPDDTTLVWKTTIPTGAPVYPPYVYIMPEHVLSQYETKADLKAWKGYPDAIGSGPFKLVEWRRGDFWRLEANEDYWGGAPKIDEFVFRVFQNEDAMIEALKQGEIDFADDISANLFDSIVDEPGITANVGNPTSFAQMSFGMCTNDVPYCKDTGFTHHPATADPAFRTAVEYAIDRDVLVERVRLGYGEPGYTVIPSPKWHFEPTDPISYDPAEANRILDDAGYADTDGDGIRETPDGEPLEMRFVVRTEAPETVDAGEFIVEWLRDIGISLKTEAVNDSKLGDIWYANDFDIYIWGWGVEPDPNFQLSTYTTSQCGIWSDTCYSSQEYDDLFKEQQSAATVEEREAIVDEMQQILYDDRPELVLWYDNYLQAYRSDKWTGFVKQPTDGGSVLFQYGHYSDLQIQPISAAGPGAGPSGDDGIQPIVWVVLVAAVVVIAAIVITRRRRSEEEAG